MAYQFRNDDGMYITPSLLSGLPNAQANKSISFWFLYTSIPGTDSGMVVLDHGSGTRTFCGIRSGNIGVYRGDETALVEVTAPVANAWHHFLYTYDGTTHRLSIDGATPTTDTTSTDTGTEDYISSSSQQDEQYSGYIDDIRIFDRKLDQSEANLIYAARGRDGVVYGQLVRMALLDGSDFVTAW